MKLAICSDLHLEFGDITLKNEGADVLILGGDIMTAQELHDFKTDDVKFADELTRRATAERYRDFLARCSAEFPHVIYIAGNHEFYHSKYPDAYKYIEEECKAFNNVYFLEQSKKEICDVTFIGATLWTDMNDGDRNTLLIIKEMMNDYRVIRNSTRNYARLSPSDTVIRHKNTLNYIKSAIKSDPNKKYVVVGHHAPSKKSVKPRYAEDIEMNGAYSSDLEDFIKSFPQIVLWTHGHTHDSFDYYIDNTRIVCNPRGYDGWELSADNFKLKYVDV
jgi:Icc-related predicted phosphoesterase